MRCGSFCTEIRTLLQAANLKLGSVLSDSMGANGRAILDALAQGKTNPERLADQVHTPMHASRAQIVEALRGRVCDRVWCCGSTAQADAIDAAIAAIDTEVSDRLEPFRQAALRLTTIPGVSDVAAAVIVSEIGVDMTRFPTAAHLISWAGLCPRNDESAGKQRSTKLRRGAPWLKPLLVQVAWAASRKKRSYFRAPFTRITA
jgi:transposase